MKNLTFKDGQKAARKGEICTLVSGPFYNGFWSEREEISIEKYSKFLKKMNADELKLHIESLQRDEYAANNWHNCDVQTMERVNKDISIAKGILKNKLK